MKSLIAYSFVNYVSVVIDGIITLSYWGFVALLPWWWLKVCVLLAFFFVFLILLMKASCLWSFLTLLT